MASTSSSAARPCSVTNRPSPQQTSHSTAPARPPGRGCPPPPVDHHDATMVTSCRGWLRQRGARSRHAQCAARRTRRSRPVGFGRILAYFLKLGAVGFGGPIATVGYMQRDLVEQRHWMDRQDFLDGVALGQTMPGPLAAQVAMWVGYLTPRRGGGRRGRGRLRSTRIRDRGRRWRALQPLLRLRDRAVPLLRHRPKRSDSRRWSSWNSHRRRRRRPDGWRGRRRSFTGSFGSAGRICFRWMPRSAGGCGEESGGGGKQSSETQ